MNALSHELRTPITTIIAATDNLQSTGDRISDADKKDPLVEISFASDRLNQQIENLVNMSRLESGGRLRRMVGCFYELCFILVLLFRW